MYLNNLYYVQLEHVHKCLMWKLAAMFQKDAFRIASQLVIDGLDSPKIIIEVQINGKGDPPVL